MRYLAFIIFLSAFTKSVECFASEDLFSGLTQLYWCTNKEIPQDLESIQNAFGFELPSSASEENFKQWLEKAIFEVNDEKLIISITKRIVKQNGEINDSITTSVSHCDSVAISTRT
jgi:hypothetical protein